MRSCGFIQPERTREIEIIPFLETIALDIRFALRCWPVTISSFPGSPFGMAQDSDQRIIMWGFRLILLAVGLVLLIGARTSRASN